MIGRRLLLGEDQSKARTPLGGRDSIDRNSKAFLVGSQKVDFVFVEFFQIRKQETSKLKATAVRQWFRFHIAQTG